jgi:uncharacterized protein YndB with AHSA1/START domain
MKNSGKLKLTTPADREIVLTRVFDAPRHLVIQALSQPELVKRWMLGPPGWSMTVCELDMKPGGTYRHVWRNTDGTEMSMRGVYREVSLPDRIVRTESFEFGCAPQSGEQLVTVVLTEKEGKTTLITSILYPSKEARDAVIASGMEYGVGLSYDRLEEIVATQ